MIEQVAGLLVNFGRASSRRCRAVIGLVAILAIFFTTTGADAKRDDRYFTNLPVVSHDGRTYKFYDELIKGKLVVINFIYTNCPDICGLQTARLSLIADRLGEKVGRDVYIYSISTDPARDTPEALANYAAAFGQRKGWLFLTGGLEELKTIRARLGERNRSLSEHRNDLVLGNDTTGEWSRTSIMLDPERIEHEILDMDPAYRLTARPEARGYAGAKARQLGKQAGEALFLKLCASCHSVGEGKKVGPDLSGVIERRGEAWLRRYIAFPRRLRAERDPIALELRQQYPNILMPTLGLSEIDAGDVLSYLRIKGEGVREKSGKPESGKLVRSDIKTSVNEGGKSVSENKGRE